MANETTDVLIIGTGFGGSIPGYYFAAGGAKVIMLERGPRLSSDQFTQSLKVGGYTRIIDSIQGKGIDVTAGNCVGGSSVVYYAASLRAPSFIFERRGTLGRRIWPKSITRHKLDKWYRRAEAAIPVSELSWNDVPYAGGVFAAACTRAGHTCQPVPVAIDLTRCTNCNWMHTGCTFDAKRSMLLNYIPAAEASGAQIRPLHEVQYIQPAQTAGYRYSVSYRQLSPDDYNVAVSTGFIEAKMVIVAAGAMGTPVILQRSAQHLGDMPPAVGRYFSANGDRVTVAALDEDKVHDLLGLERAPGVAYDAFPIGKPISAMTFDYLNPSAPEFSRFGLQQIYFPPITNILPGVDEPPVWFGVDKRDLTSRWRSWLTVLAMTEDANEGVFDPPPDFGNFKRVGPGAAVGQLKYDMAPETTHGFSLSDAASQSIMTLDGLATLHLVASTKKIQCAHPLASCRIGDDPKTSALDDRHELRGHPGIFV
ncbi:MAG TPA: GMC family oxidoreductase N-terminal domain-containing protein, partial [Vicinamibacterales bacterium]|nr:GMC family oxidoreductase N-terminal domain-containing protein [Vicinamibacterales bacterium]